jgi:hypothetical protein
MGPHKHASREEQDAMLENLQTWVAGYYKRDDAWAHRALFDALPGVKREITTLINPAALDRT